MAFSTISVKENALSLFNQNKTRLRISITSLCNLSCVFCHKEGMSGYHDETFMSFEKFKRVIATYVELGGREVNITGGEPLLHKEIKEMLNFLSEYPEIHVTLSTNGLLLNYVNLNIVTEPISETKISFHTFNQELATKLLGSNYNVKKVKENIAEHVKKGYRTILNFTLTTENKNEVEDLVKWVNEIGVHLKISDLGITEDNVDYVNKSYLDSLNFKEIVEKYSTDKKILSGKRSGTNMIMYTLPKGNHVLIKDRHSEQLKTEMCDKCENYTTCSEGVFALRLNPNGVYQPCLNMKKFNTDPKEFPDYTDKEIMEIAINRMFNGI